MMKLRGLSFSSCSEQLFNVNEEELVIEEKDDEDVQTPITVIETNLQKDTTTNDD